MHVSPERYIDISAPFFSNQLEVITNIAKALPAEYKLYVKEHFAMKPLHWRKTSFYKQILSLPNVEFIHPLVSADEIIRKSSLVIAITGTSALQAAFFEKPSIVFAHNIYEEFLSSVIRISSYEELSDGIAPREAERLVLDSSKAKERLGWMTYLTLTEGIILAADWYRRVLTANEPAFDVTMEQVSCQFDNRTVA